MDGLRELLMELKDRGLAQGNFLGLLNVFIGRHIEAASGEVLSAGLNWREMAELLKRVRWEKSAVRELGIEPANLPPRDRARYWYQAVLRARLHSEDANAAGDRLATSLESLGYRVGASPPQAKGK
jgi:hypothetical protein